MQKIYVLLRDNKQSGPFTLEEIVALSLKDNDLIWIEGKAAGWSYPKEIEALKPFLSTTNEVKQDADTLQTDKLKNTQSQTHVYVSLPQRKSEQQAVPLSSFSSAPTSIDLGEEDPTLALERKAKELRDKIQAFEKQKVTPKQEGDLDIKYKRSLDDIKEEYSSWMQEQKLKRKPILQSKLLFAFTCLFLIAIFLGVKFFLSNKSDKDPLAVNSLASGVKTVVNENVADVENFHESKKQVVQKEPVRKMPQPILEEKVLQAEAPTEPDAIDKYIDSLRWANRQQKGEATEEYQTLEEKIVSQEPIESIQEKRAHPEIAKKPDRTTETTEAPIQQSIRISEKVSEDENNDRKKLVLYNGSTQSLRFVAVDVYYYKSNKTLLEKRTVYFHKVAPQSSTLADIPQLKKAASVEYELGLISTENKLYYAKQ